MKYLLDEDEYRELNNKHALKLIDQNRIIADLCRRIANTNTDEWVSATGNICIRDIPVGQLGGYCSGCPVVKICTYPNKRHAK